MNLLIERRSFDQKYKSLVIKMTLCGHGGIYKKSCGICTYDKWNFKPQISSIFHFDWVSDGRMAHILGVNQLPAARKGFKNGSSISTNVWPFLFWHRIMYEMQCHGTNTISHTSKNIVILSMTVTLLIKMQIQGVPG